MTEQVTASHSESNPGSSPRSNSVSNPGRLPVWRKLVYAFLVVVLFLGGAELLCRILGLGKLAPVEEEIAVWNRSPDGRDFWAFHGREYNSDGMRDRAHAIDKPPGTRRIACLGDSVTMGYKLTVGDAFPFFLEREFAATGGGVEVFNIAIAGWSTRQHVQAYHKIARKYDPDLVLLGICLNDIPEMHNNLVGPPPMAIGILMRHSALIRWLIDAEAREVHRIEELFTDPSSRAVRSGYEAFFNELLTLRDDVVRDGKAFAIVVFPFRLQLEPGAPSALPQEAISSFARRQGLRCLDVLPALREIGSTTFIDASHFSRRGAEIVASETHEWLETWWPTAAAE